MPCGLEQELFFDDLKENIWQPLLQHRYPMTGTIELTERCNYNCVHCYINQPANDPAARQNELSTPEMFDVIDQLAAAGVLFLLITGGEPLLRPDFVDIFKHAREKGLVITLFTNGALLTPEIAAVLADYGIRGIEISLYGATPQTFEAMTRRPGAYQHCIRGIETALDYGLPSSLKSFVVRTNQHELAQMRAIADDYGVPFRYDTLLWPRVDHRNNGHDHDDELQLSIEEMIRLDIEDPERLGAWQDVITERHGLKTNSEYIFNCGAAYHSFHIDAHGNLSPCAMVRVPCYNLLKINFTDAWEKLGQVRSLKRTHKVECADCDYAILCNQCTGWSQAVIGDAESVVPFICQLTKRRMQALKEINTIMEVK